MRSLRIPAPPLPRALWTEIISTATSIEVPAQSSILGAGASRQVVAVLGGLARVFLRAGAGAEATIGYARAGQLIGLAQVLGVDELGAEAVTGTRVARISSVRMRALLAERPEVAWRMIEWQAECLVGAMRSITEGVHEPVTARVARHLVDMSMTVPGGQVVAPVTHHYLAAAVGTVREVATRALRELRRLGLVETGPGHIVLLDPEALGRLAEHPGSGPRRPGTGSRGPR
jgi:CRP-like cAMP-binding protein